MLVVFSCCPELSAGIIQDGDLIKFDLMSSADDLPKEYRNVDIIQGDQLIMMNGKRIKTIDDLKATYESVGIGEDIKFGIKRDGKNDDGLT